MKYKLTGDTKVICDRTLYRIVCVTAFASVSVGDIGGWVESVNNLSQDGNAWVCGNAKVYGDAEVYGDAKVCGFTDFMVLKNSWSSGRSFTYTASNKKFRVGCFYGTGKELIEKSYKDSEISGKCYEASVKYVEEIERIKKELQK